MGLSENHVGQAVDSYLSVLEQQGRWWGWKNQTGKGMLVPFVKWHHARKDGEGHRLIRDYAGHAFETGRPGSPDRVGIFRSDDGTGKFVAIELKTDIGSQREEQRAAQRAIESLGGIYVLARGVRDVEARLVPRREPRDDPGDWAPPF